MNFLDKIQEMDYELKEKLNHVILIEKKANISDLIILFNVKEKYVSGYLKANDLIKDLQDISHQYTLFRELQNDLKTLAKLSGYAII